MISLLNKYSVSRSLFTYSGVIPVILGISVLFGWYSSNATLIQISPDFAPMQFNTALGFILSGLGILSIIYRKKNVGLFLGVILFLIGITTLTEYVFSIDLGIDQLLMEPYIVTQTSHPGRMAPNTALGFLLTGLVLIRLAVIDKTWKSFVDIATLGSMIIILGIVAITDYVVSIEAAYGWGGFARMAVHTAIGFIIVGATFLAYAWQQSPRNALNIPSWLPLQIGLAVLAVVLCFWQGIHAFQHKLLYEYDIHYDIHIISDILLIIGVALAIVIALMTHFALTSLNREKELLDTNIKLATEIIERKQAEEKSIRFSRVFENSLNEIFLFDSESLKFVQVNDIAIKNLGYSMEELREMTPIDFNPDYTLGLFKDLLDPIRRGIKDRLFFETVHRRKDGSLYDVEVHLQLLKHESESLFSAIVVDITDSNKLKSQLSQAQKMEAIGHLTGGIAHDFNNILTAVLGYAYMIDETIKDRDDDTLKKYLANIINGGVRAQKLVEGMLLFSRTDTKNIEPVSVSDIVKETMNLLSSSLPSSVDIKLCIDHKVPLILIDPTKLEQILMNICINAKDAMEGAGELTIEVQKLSIPSPQKEFTSNVLGNERLRMDVCFCSKELLHLHHGDYVEISIQDTGSGMSIETLDHIFEPFYTSKDVGKGTGMGLSITHGIMQNAKGHIIIETQENKGSLFRLLFKAHKPSKSDIKPETIKHIDFSNYRNASVLLVDDEVTVLDYISDLLTYNGYEVIKMADSKSAYSLFKASPYRFDLIITDQTMPDLTGLDLSKQILKIRPDIPIVLCSGFSEIIDEVKIEASGIYTYLNKPLSPNVILRTVNEALNS
jgi:PAS domain S-box-containing protein